MLLFCPAGTSRLAQLRMGLAKIDTPAMRAWPLKGSHYGSNPGKCAGLTMEKCRRSIRWSATCRSVYRRYDLSNRNAWRVAIDDFDRACQFTSQTASAVGLLRLVCDGGWCEMGHRAAGYGPDVRAGSGPECSRGPSHRRWTKRF